MRKSFTILMALVITFFTVPFGGITALADEKVYDDIEDGEHSIVAKALHADKDEASGAATFIEEDASLIIKEGHIELIIKVEHNDFATISGIQIEGIEPTVNEDATYRYLTFELEQLTSYLDARTQYVVPAMDIDHDVPLRFHLEGLDDLPKKEEEPTGPESPEENEGEDGEAEQPESPEDEDAVQPEVIEIADGDYTIEYEALHATEDKESGMARYLENQASLSVSNGKTLLTLTINDHKAVTGFQVEKDGTLIEPKDVTVNDKENSREVTYELDELLSTVKAQVQYTVGAHNGDQPLRLTFNEDSLVKIEIEDPEDENTPESELDPEDLAKGVYTLDYTFLKKGEDQASSMDNFTDGPAFVKVDKDGNQIVALTLTSANMIQWFKVNNQEVTILQEDEENNTRIIEFAVGNLMEKQGGNVFVEVPGMYSTEHEVDLLFDVNSLKTVEDSEYPENKNVEQQPEPEETEEPVEEKPGKEPTKPETPTTPVEQSELIPDKAYEIDYVVNHENGTSVSISNEFFAKPAILLEKDGIKYIQITITNGELVKDLSNKYGEALLVDTKEDGSIAVQLRINDDLADMLIDMHIIVPSGFFPGFPGYDEQHKAILVFDKDSMKEIDVDKYLLVPGSEENKNGPTIKGGGSGETISEEGPGKPDFDRNDDSGKTDKDIKKPGENNNPQTGDTTSILLYSMLLMGSLIPLAVKLRRRFI